MEERKMIARKGHREAAREAGQDGEADEAKVGAHREGEKGRRNDEAQLVVDKGRKNLKDGVVRDRGGGAVHPREHPA